MFDTISFPDDIWLGLIAVCLAMVLSMLSGKIDVIGGLVGGMIAMAIFLGGGFPALSLLLIFFVLGSLASHWKMKWKQSVGLAEKNRGRRSSIHALSNAGVAALCGLLSWFFPDQTLLFESMLAASLASATSDTLSSELGNVYGKQFINILSGKPDTRGLDGVISFEGTLIGASGSLLLAFVWGAWTGWPSIWIGVALAGLAGNLFDSVLGATLQRSGWLSNHGVNAGNTMFAATLMLLSV